MIGEGGFGCVFRAAGLAALPDTPLAIKKGESVADLRDLKREVAILQKCKHQHLLPLLGYCLRKEAPCLAFPLMRGGSLQCRLNPTGEHWTSLRRLGFASPPPPLSWRQRLRIVCEALDAHPQARAAATAMLAVVKGKGGCRSSCKRRQVLYWGWGSVVSAVSGIPPTGPYF